MLKLASGFSFFHYNTKISWNQYCFFEHDFLAFVFLLSTVSNSEIRLDHLIEQISVSSHISFLKQKWCEEEQTIFARRCFVRFKRISAGPYWPNACNCYDFTLRCTHFDLGMVMSLPYLLSDLCLFIGFIALIYNAFPYTEGKCYDFICPRSPSSLRLPDVPSSFKQCAELCSLQ